VSDERWQTISSKELQGQFNDILFMDSTTGWIVGNKMEMPLKNQAAVIYKTTDGGYTWTPDYIGKGSFEIIRYVNDTLFGIKHIYNNNSYEDVNSVLVKSYDKGQNWKEVTEIPGITKQLLLRNAKTGYLIVKNKESNVDDWKLLETNDGGLSWKGGRLFNHVQSCLLVDNSIFINQHNGNSLLILDLEKDSLTTEIFPENFRSELMIKDNHNSIWVIGSDSSDFVLLKREDKNKFLRIEFSMIKDAKPYDFYTHIHIYDNVISIITGDGGTIVGVVKRFFVSYDLGKNWIEEYIPFPMITEPIYFNNERIWSYYGTGLQLRK
jgi:hypothetical protein